MRRTPATVVTGVVGVVVLAVGVATAVSRAHHDRAGALPPVCRDTVGAPGGGLPNGRLLDLALGNVLRDGSAGAPKALAARGGSAALGAGTEAELEARARALTGAGAAVGGGGGAGGAGGAGTGGGSGPSTGPGGGVGAQPRTGSGGGTQTGSPLPAVVRPQQHPRAAGPVARRHHAGAGWWVLAAVLATLVLAYGLWRARGRRRRVTADPGLGAGLGADAASARAREARRRNDLDAALRWTFVAGLLRLDDAGVLPYDPARTTRAVGRRLRSRLFTDLATVFDRVAYGGRRATEEDVDGAVRGWDRLLVEAKRS